MHVRPAVQVKLDAAGREIYQIRPMANFAVSVNCSSRPSNNPVVCATLVKEYPISLAHDCLI